MNDLRSPHRSVPVLFSNSLLWIGLCWLSWEGMQVLHESGHVIAALLTGGTISAIELHPWQISRTDISPNPQPLPVVWGGPVAGIFFPLILWLGAGTFAKSVLPLFQFFAGFCLIANGAYLGSAVFDPIGDAADLLKFGAARWHLIMFSALTVPTGIWFWDGLSAKIGMGKTAPPPPSTWSLWIWGLLIPLLMILSVSQ